MSFFLKLAAYAFLALMGFSAWSAGVEGWRYYFAIVLFIVCVLRILTMLRQHMANRSTSKDTDAQPQQTADDPAATPDKNTPEQ